MSNPPPPPAKARLTRADHILDLFHSHPVYRHNAASRVRKTLNPELAACLLQDDSRPGLDYSAWVESLRTRYPLEVLLRPPVSAVLFSSFECAHEQDRF